MLGVSKERNLQKALRKLSSASHCFLLVLPFNPPGRGQHIPPKCLALSELYNIATQKTVLFIAVYLFFFYTPLWT
jgi:hypothetical protein